MNRSFVSLPAAIFVLLVLALSLIVVFAPMITIWAFNTLFDFGIQYTFTSWLAVAWIHILVMGSVLKINGKKS